MEDTYTSLFFITNNKNFKHMKKILLVLSIFCLFSCADSKVLNIDGKDTLVEPYGWMNDDVLKNDSVQYQVNTGNVVWSIIGFETIIVPIILTGNSLYEPVKVKNSSSNKQ